MQNLVQRQQPQPHALDLTTSGLRLAAFIAISTAGRKLVQRAEVVAPHLQFATIEGESGVGKQALARLLHDRSPLAGSSFSHCDAREWLLSEIDPQFLAGFTYLDRVDLLAAPGQGLLLRVLKALQNRPAGAFALMASSETSLCQMASEGRFLPDLAFRFSAIRFAIPPLRERREDIAPLAAFFLEWISQRYRLPHLRLAPGAIARLLQHDWPANARELSSVLESAVLNSPDGVIRAEDLPIVATPLPTPRPAAPSSQVLNLDAVIHNHIRLALELNHGNKLKTARQLGISRSTLYRMLDADSPASR
ncbi:MAG: sigma 54-interacting transcriptional regulator [Terracidiphilus sp.]